MENETIFILNGTPCVLEVTHDDDGDCIKMWHELRHLDTGAHVATVAWSPYSVPTDDEVRQWIALGCPEGLRWSNSHPLSRFNFCGEFMAKFLAGTPHPTTGATLELVFRK